MTTAIEHPTFTRVKAMPEPWRSHFPKSREECDAWTHRVLRTALAKRVLAVAHTRIEGAWCAYCDAVMGLNHDNEEQPVLRHGSKLGETLARVLFPQFEGVPYAD